MERIRNQIAQEALRPQNPSEFTSSPIYISSDADSAASASSSLSSAVPAVRTHARVRKNVILDSDEEVESDSDIVELDHPSQVSEPLPALASHRSVSLQPAPLARLPPVASKAQSPLQPLRPATNGVLILKPLKPGYIPTHGPDRSIVELEAETFDAPVNPPYEYEYKKTAAEADKELKELFEGAMQDGPAEIDMSEAIVEGFADGITLKPHQIAGRIWMRERESGRKLGGMLCDDMGLGKTIQTVVRIVDGPPSKEDRKKGWSKATLVICPVALVKQWAQEIKKYTGGTLRVIEHYGPSRTSDPDLLARANVVVTSYNIAVSEYASWSGDAKDKTSGAKPKKKKGDSESDAESGDSDSSSNFGKTLKQGRAKKVPTKKKTKKLCALFNVQWWRIVLDEAHNIKNHKTKSALACCALSAKYRWALTGTPVQNSVEDLFSLLKFLGIRPLNDWTHFNDTIAKPVKLGRTARAMKRLHVVMKAIMLRRRKDAMHDGAPLIQLPPRTLEIVPCDFDEDERNFYTALESKTNLTMNKFMKQGEVMRNYTEILILLLRLRQACNHPILISKDFHKDADALDSKPAGRSQQDDDDDDSGLAELLQKMGVDEPVKRCDVCRTGLDHDNVSSGSLTRCRDCEHQIAIEKRRKSGRVGSDLPPSSAKIRKIMELLNLIEEKTDGQEKTIIFSQFTTMLDLIEPFLGEEGIQYVRYDGSMNAKQREVSLEKIRKSNSTRVILISFKAGGAGLNLTACNNVILVDLWWNPALEEQAFGRVHRYGQERDVMIYKLTIENTVEARILALQEKKSRLANAALSGDKFKNNKLGMEDLVALFRAGGKDDSDEDE